MVTPRGALLFGVPQNGQTAIIVPVPAIDHILAAIGREYPATIRPGIPAHVSLLYPFLPAADITDETIEWLRTCARNQSPLEVEFDAVHQEPGFVYLENKEFDGLAAKVQSRWPDLLPYGGKYGLGRPTHLTLAMKVDDSDLESISDIAHNFLPVAAVANQLMLVSYHNGWRSDHVFLFEG